MVNYEVVLASGEVVQANAKTYSDLFIALEGCSNNFGIVTHLDWPTSKQGQMWGGGWFCGSSAVPQVIQAFNGLAASVTPDEHAHLIAGTSFTAGTETAVSDIYRSSNVVAAPSLKPYTQTHRLYQLTAP